MEEKELIRNISHDLKTPLTAIKGYVEGIQDGIADTPQKQEKYLRTIANKVNDMDKLIDELTIYSKLDTNRVPYSFAKIPIKGYFDDCCEEIKIDLEAQGIDLDYRCYAGCVYRCRCGTVKACHQQYCQQLRKIPRRKPERKNYNCRL